MRYVYATSTCVVVDKDQMPTTLVANEPWDPNAELVHLRPELFSDEPLVVRGRQLASPIEMTTAEPGQVRRGPGRPRSVAP
jgi:hypothetical protein